MCRIPREEEEMMSSLLGSGFEAPQTPSMSRGDGDSVEESKMPETAVVDADNSGGNDLHGDAKLWTAGLILILLWV